MTPAEAEALIRRLLKAQDEDELMRLVSLSLPIVDGAFFAAAEASAQELDRTGRLAAARALRGLTARILSMKTLI